MSLRVVLPALILVTTAVPSAADWPAAAARARADTTADAVVSGTGLVLTRVSDRQGVTSIVSPPDGSGRLFLTESAGRIVIVTGPTTVTTFLDITSLIPQENRFVEQGLLSLAFHPGYQFNRQFYIQYTDLNGDVVVARYTTSMSDPTLADPSSARVLLTIPHRDSPVHNGGQLAFGPDGDLYVAVGDGGISANGQSTTTLLGKILRLHVDGAAPYTIPSGNPYASGGGRPEIWALGLRNPWRFSFDRTSGDLWLADVGQDMWEEINRLPAGTGAGANFGWSRMEGAHCYLSSSCDTTGLVLPVVEYAHGGSPYACSVTGGYRYRGGDIVGLGGAYLFADFCSCALHVARESSPGAFRMDTLAPTLCGVSTFGQDARGELYVASLGNGVYRVDVGTTPRVHVANVQSREGRSGTSLLRFTITRFPAPTTPISFAVTTLGGGTATAGSDYVPLNTTVTMAAHQSFADFEVEIVGDVVEEPDETVLVSASGDGVTVPATGTIVNDDGRLLLQVEQGPENRVTFGFRPYLSKVVDAPVSFNWQTRDGTAAAGEDYSASSGSVVIPAGVQWGDLVTIPVVDDELVEPNETFAVDITDIVGTTGASSFSVAITNDDLGPQMTVPAISVTEGDVDHVASLTVRLSAASTQTITAHYATDDSGGWGPTPDLDYVPTSGDLTFPPGTTELTFPVQILGDTLDELDAEELRVRFTNVVNARAPVSATLTIRDDDPLPALVVDDVTVAERTVGVHEVEISYRLSAPSGRNVFVAPTFVDGTAVGRSSSSSTRFNILQPAGEPAAPSPAVFDFGVGAGSRVDRLELAFWNWTAARPVDLDVLLAAPDGRSLVLLSDVGGTTPVTTSGSFRDHYPQLAPDRPLGAGSPTDHDDGPDAWPEPTGPRITSLADFRGADASGPWKLSVVNDGASSSSLYQITATVHLRADYSSETWAVDALLAGRTTGRLRLNIVDDREVEGAETFQVCLGSTYATTGCGTVTITDDDAQSLFVEAGVGSESRQFARVPVRLAAPAESDVTLAWTASSGTATAGADFPATSGTFVIPAGKVDAYLDVPVVDDPLWESTETFTVQVSSADVPVSVPESTVEVTDDENPPLITIGPATAPEGGLLRFPVTLTGATTRTASLQWSTADWTAWAGVDYVASSGALTFPPGTTTGWIEVATLYDNVAEGDERLDVVVTSLSNATMGSLRAPGTVTNFTIPGPPRISFSGGPKGNGDPAAPEDGGSITFTVSLSWPWKERVRMRAMTMDGSAVALLDYVPTTQIVAFEPGETQKTVTVTLLPDAVDELDKTFSLVLSRVTGGTLADPVALGRIVDDDPTPPGSPTVSIGDGRVLEGPRLTSTSMFFTVSLSAPATRLTTVSYATGGGTATAGNDYAAKTASVAFRVGERSKTVFVKVKGDHAVEPDETVVVTLTSAANAFLGDVEGVGTIVNDDR